MIKPVAYSSGGDAIACPSRSMKFPKRRGIDSKQTIRRNSMCKAASTTTATSMFQRYRKNNLVLTFIGQMQRRPLLLFPPRLPSLLPPKLLLPKLLLPTLLLPSPGLPMVSLFPPNFFLVFIICNLFHLSSLLIAVFSRFRIARGHIVYKL